MPTFFSQLWSSPRPVAASPWAALVDGRWWLALGVLTLNDWIFKGAGILPSVVTGKLSDVAGLVVAPALLMCLLNRQSRRAWAFVHLVIAVVFAGLELSTACERLVENMGAAIGMPWRLTADPSDLWTLPALLWSWHWFVAAPARPQPMARLRWAAQGLPLVLGLWCCAASALSGGADRFEGDNQVGQVFLYNDSDETLPITTRRLRVDLTYNCEGMLADPSHVLQVDLFDAPTAVSLAPRSLLALPGDEAAFDPRCQAVWLDLADGPHVVLWGQDRIDREAPFEGSRNQAIILDAIFLTATPDKVALLQSEKPDLVFPVQVPLMQSPPMCPAPGTQRVDWESRLENVTGRLQTLVPGTDGCIGLDLVIVGEKDSAPVRRYLCLPPEAFPFATGETLQFTPVGTSAPGTHGVVRALVVQAVPADARLLLLSRGAAIAAFADFTFEVTTVAECGFVYHASCATSNRSLQVVAQHHGQTTTLVGNHMPIYFDVGNGNTARLELLGADEFATSLLECEQTPSLESRYGRELDFVGTIQPGPLPEAIAR